LCDGETNQDWEEDDTLRVVNDVERVCGFDEGRRRLEWEKGEGSSRVIC